MQYVQSAAFWQPVVLQSSCPVMPVLTEHGLEIAGLVLRGWKKPQLERLPCAQRCDHNIIKWKKAGNNGQGQGKEESSLVMNGRVSKKLHAWKNTTIVCSRLYVAAVTWSNYFIFNHTLEVCSTEVLQCRLPSWVEYQWLAKLFHRRWHQKCCWLDFAWFLKVCWCYMLHV